VSERARRLVGTHHLLAEARLRMKAADDTNTPPPPESRNVSVSRLSGLLSLASLLPPSPLLLLRLLSLVPAASPASAAWCLRVRVASLATDVPVLQPAALPSLSGRRPIARCSAGVVAVGGSAPASKQEPLFNFFVQPWRLLEG
jgi:hypothetical protein